jgi:flagellar biosynthesis/type III secretory pathway protein FliH
MQPLRKALSFDWSLRRVRVVPTPHVGAAPGEPRAAESEQAAYERGRRDAEKALQQQLLQQRTDLMELQNGVLNSLRQVLPRVAGECESALVELALEAARKLVAGLPLSAEMVEAAVREALAQVQETTEFTVRLHPEDLELLRRAQSSTLPSQENCGPIRFEPSQEISRGGCLVQTRFGVIDARRETKFEMLTKSLHA